MLQERHPMNTSGTTPYDPNDTTPWEPLDENLFRQELTALIPHLRAFSRSLCGNATLADDVAQDAMLKAWKSREKFKPGSNLKAWTFTILRNQFYSIKRRSWRATSLDQQVAEQTIVAKADQEKVVELNELRRGLDSLKDDQREALILVGASGLSYDEAAEICGCAVALAKSWKRLCTTLILTVPLMASAPSMLWTRFWTKLSSSQIANLNPRQESLHD
jgi:RNA polymerase sigma-70 factor (ECF subfamily)